MKNRFSDFKPSTLLVVLAALLCLLFLTLICINLAIPPRDRARQQQVLDKVQFEEVIDKLDSIIVCLRTFMDQQALILDDLSNDVAALYAMNAVIIEWAEAKGIIERYLDES